MTRVKRPRLSSLDIPQANSLDKLLSRFRSSVRNGSWEDAPGLRDKRDRSYYRDACRILGLIDASGAVSPLGQALIDNPRKNPRHALKEAFARSLVGQEWLAWAGVSNIDGLDPASAQDFLCDRLEAATSTRLRRASTLRQWLTWLQAKVMVESPVEARQWPSPHHFPHNEAGESVREILEQDLSSATSVLMVVGYASLDQIIEFLVKRLSQPTHIKLLFGWEPFDTRKSNFKSQGQSMADEVRDYWLSRGVSVTLSGTIIQVSELIKHEQVEVRLAPRNRPIHAKIYIGEHSAILGSSNFTLNGLKKQSEANARFSRQGASTRYREARDLAEGLWAYGQDYKEDLLSLLEALLKQVMWQEALARGCAALLEGEWARKYVPPELIGSLARPLWPHQLQGIAQALWILENVGSVLVADAAGSGKTRMGAWLVRSAFDRQHRMGQQRPSTVIVVPPQVVEQWEVNFQETALPLKVHSHGPLSNSNASWHAKLLDTLSDIEILAVDEAHNFLNWSDRTRRLVSHYADNVILFTATPINKGASDLLALVELLGADNLPESSLSLLTQLRRPPSATSEQNVQLLKKLREEIRRFTVRRTRSELNRIAEDAPKKYLLEEDRAARYPLHEARHYDCKCGKKDIQLARQIARLAGQLTGISRLGSKLERPVGFEGSEAAYLDRVLSSARALARHHVMKCLRSSRAALYEHVHGTAAAFSQATLGLPQKGSRGKDTTGDMVGRTRALGGKVPEWRLKTLERQRVEPRWLWDAQQHRLACEEEASRYELIGHLVLRMSDDRERAKLDALTAFADKHQQILAFDSHVITLKLFLHQLQSREQNAVLLTGAGGTAAKRRARETLGPKADQQRLIALCSDAFSEGLNLQSASCVVHLDTPTVIRTAEQRAGRVDRMDSRHPTIQIYWPKDPEAFAPQQRDRLRERHGLVTDLIGSNLRLPDEAEPDIEDTQPLDVKALISQAIPHKDTLEQNDAFWAVRSLIAGTDRLVEPKLYEGIRTSEAEVVACVSAVQSEAPWAFLVVGGYEREAPRWVLFEGPESPPMTDLGHIGHGLRLRLDLRTRDLDMSHASEELILRFTERLRDCEHQLLPLRRQRALRLFERVMEKWLSRSDARRREELEELKGRLFPSCEARSQEVYPDPRAVADAWLRLLRPRIKQVLEKRRRRRRFWRLDELEESLLKDPFPLEVLARAFAEVRLLQPVARRIIAMIVGVPP